MGVKPKALHILDTCSSAEPDPSPSQENFRQELYAEAPANPIAIF